MKNVSNGVKQAGDKHEMLLTNDFFRGKFPFYFVEKHFPLISYFKYIKCVISYTHIYVRMWRANAVGHTRTVVAQVGLAARLWRPYLGSRSKFCKKVSFKRNK